MQARSSSQDKTALVKSAGPAEQSATKYSARELIVNTCNYLSTAKYGEVLLNAMFKGIKSAAKSSSSVREGNKLAEEEMIFNYNSSG